MKKTILCLIGCFIVLSPLAVWGLSGIPNPSKQASALSVRTERLSVHSDPAPEAGFLSDMATLQSYLDSVNRAKYDQLVQQVQVANYVEAVQAAQAAQAAEEQSRAEQQARGGLSQGTAAPIGGTTVGECTGFAIPDYIIQRESGGNPSAMNPSGAYGCAQTLLSHYSGGSCSGLDPYTIEGQRECVNILSNGGTNLAPWALTR